MILEYILQYYKSILANDKAFFEQEGLISEKYFYKSILGLAWGWIRLIVFKHSTFIQETYERELNSFIDIVELEHH